MRFPGGCCLAALLIHALVLWVERALQGQVNDGESSFCKHSCDVQVDGTCHYKPPVRIGGYCCIPLKSDTSCDLKRSALLWVPMLHSLVGSMRQPDRTDLLGLYALLGDQHVLDCPAVQDRNSPGLLQSSWATSYFRFTCPSTPAQGKRP